MKGLAVVFVAGLVAVSSAASRRGGWAVVTVENPPDLLVAGQANELTFTVRQHGVTLLGDLKPQIEARSRTARATGKAWATQKTGTYRASITVPDTGFWEVTIHSGFGRSKGTMLPLLAVTPGKARPVVAESERGRRLFAAKGCVACHVHDGVAVAGEVQFAPNLTDRRFPAAYLAQFLANPSIKPPVNDARMPNLDLKPTEITALVAFINGERKVGSR